MPDDYIRCFVALAPDSATRQRLQALPRMGRARPVLPEDLHLTLAFLGDLDAERAHALARALPPLATAVPTLEADGLALWPTPQRARVIVASYVAAPEVVTMHEQVVALGVDLGIEAEARRYRPHITVARLPRTLRVMPQQALDSVEFSSGPATFTHLGLYARAAEGSGQRYQALIEMPLPNGAAST